MPATKKELIWAALVMFAIPLVCEALLRAARVHFEPELYMADLERGWILRPGASGVVSTETPQFVRINSHGFRDQERTYNKPVSTLRIAVLGNSWTEALQVPLEKTYCSVLEKKLTGSACFGGRPVEVLNFGVAGYSTGQELLLLQQELWKYQPDMVVLGFYPARDIANNVRELNNAADPDQSPYFVYRDEKLVFDDSFRGVKALQPQQITMQNIRYELSTHVRVVQAVATLQRFGKLRAAMATAKERAEKSGVENPEYSIYAPPSQPAMLQAWKVTEGLLVAMNEEVKAHGAEFRVVVLATRPQVIPDSAKRVELMRKLGVQNLSYADERIREVAARRGILVTTLAPALSTYAEEGHIYLNGFSTRNFGAGHWNETGHRLAAETIAADLCGAAGKGAPSVSAAVR